MGPSKEVLVGHLAYSEWATNRILSACGKVAVDVLARDLGSSHGGLLGTLRHMYASDQVWLNRLLGTATIGVKPAREPEFAEIVEGWPELWMGFQRWLESMPEERLGDQLHSRRLNGEAFSLEYWKVIFHVVNHATLHRGQVVGQLRQVGGTPPQTDMLFYCLEMKKAAEGSA